MVAIMYRKKKKARLAEQGASSFMSQYHVSYQNAGLFCCSLVLCIIHFQEYTDEKPYIWHCILLFFLLAFVHKKIPCYCYIVFTQLYASTILEPPISSLCVKT